MAHNVKKITSKERLARLQ